MWNKIDPNENWALNINNSRAWRELELYIEPLTVNWYKYTHKCIRNSNAIAIRFMESVYLSPEDKEEFENEVKILRNIHHTKIVALLGCNFTNNYWFVTEFPSSSNLFDAILTIPAPEIKVKTKIAKDVAEGMLFLHTQKIPIAHLDLTSRNIFVFNIHSVDVGAKIAGFHQAQYLTATLKTRLLNEQPRWQAPECLQRHPYGAPADVYSFGILLLEIFSWQIVFNDMTVFNIQILNDIVAGKRPNIPESIPKTVAQLIKHCWEQEPHKRPNFKEIVKTLNSI